MEVGMRRIAVVVKMVIGMRKIVSVVKIMIRINAVNMIGILPLIAIDILLEMDAKITMIGVSVIGILPGITIGILPEINAVFMMTAGNPNDESTSRNTQTIAYCVNYWSIVPANYIYSCV